jgi:2-polyprenyl-3-methyl-5-hydroxy-6-metoxy-1,4-benzoquinol methylase
MPAWLNALRGPTSRRLVGSVLEGWPEHEPFLERSFQSRSLRELELTEHLAELVERLHPGDSEGLLRGYRWMCEMVREEELNFRRTGSYRYSSFEQVNQLVYQRLDCMTDYMNGLLLSSVLWSNHTASFCSYADTFLRENAKGYRHLEVGPGHGLLLFLAAMDPGCSSLTALDISAESLKQTQRGLAQLGVRTPAECLAADVAQPLALGQRFDSVVVSEVCEHLEAPRQALGNLRGVMVPGGRIFVNVPVNSPAIDHIYLLKAPEEVVDLVRSAGFEIEGVSSAPATGYTEARARKFGAAISVCVIGRAP